MEDNANYRIPDGFNPWISLDALRGLADALELFMHHGPGTQEPIPCNDRCSLDGLIELLHRETHALHDYFTALGDLTTLKLPLTDSDFESLHVANKDKDEVPEYGDFIREEPAVYLVR